MFDSSKGTLAVVVLIKVFIYGGTNLMAEANGKKIADIYWNTTNHIFYFDNDMHVLVVRIRDSVDVICPSYSPGYPEERQEYSILYVVDSRSYETCTVDSRKAKVFGICSRPDKKQVITVVFREFSPLPGGLEFRPNKTYYVISTSDGSKSGLHNEQGGLCKYYNMRLKFHVKPRCRTSSAVDSDDSRQEDEECQDSEKQHPPRVPLWEVDMGPPPFPRRPFIWPNSIQAELSPDDQHGRSGLTRSAGSPISFTSNLPFSWLLPLLLVVIQIGLR